MGDQESGSTGRRRAVITGGCGDIGTAMAKRLVRDGFAVTLVDLLDAPAAESVVASVRALAGDPRSVDYAQVDVTDHDGMAGLFGRLDRVDVAIANAGIGRSAPILDLTLDQWRAHLDTNLTGAFSTGQAAARRMVQDGRPGLLLFTGSWIGSVPWPEMAAYIASKAGIEMLAKQFARELATHGIRANVIAPGIVRAGMARVQLETEPQYAARAARVVPLGELQSVDSVADAVGFLCSPGAAYMTGAKLTVDGGCSLFAFD